MIGLGAHLRRALTWRLRASFVAGIVVQSSCQALASWLGAHTNPLLITLIGGVTWVLCLGISEAAMRRVRDAEGQMFFSAIVEQSRPGDGE